MVSVRIGVSHYPQPVEIEVEGTADEIVKNLEEAKNNNDQFVWFTQEDGSKSGIIIEKIATVEIRGETSKKVGF